MPEQNEFLLDVAQGSGHTTATKHLHQSMSTFLIIVVEVPEHGGVRDCGLWVLLVRSVDRRELDRIADEEYREIIHYEVLVALLGEELRLYVSIVCGNESNVRFTLTAKPLMSRTVSGEPFSPATVEIRASRGVFLPMPVKKLHDVMCEMS